LVYDDIRRIVDLLDAEQQIPQANQKAGDSSNARQYKVTERLWTVLDPESSGFVNFDKFLKCLFPYAHRNATTMAWTDKAQLTAPAVPTSRSEGPLILDTNILLKDFLNNMLKYVSNEKKKSKMDQTTFQPVITNRSKQLARQKEKEDKFKIQNILKSSSRDRVAGKEVDKLNTTDLMFARHLLKQEKLETVKKQVIGQIMESCTFKPEINRGARLSKPRDESFISVVSASTDNPSRHRGSSSHDRTLVIEDLDPDQDASEDADHTGSKLNVHDRLYAYKDKPRPAAVISEALIQELQECTFKPKVYPKPRRATISVQVPLAKDFEKSVNRIKQAREERIKKLSEVEVDHSYTDETYRRSRQLAAKGVAPFHLRTQERELQKEFDRKRKNKFRYSSCVVRFVITKMNSHVMIRLDYTWT
jgi:hypothetical protein